MPQLSRHNIRAISDIRKYDTMSELQVLSLLEAAAGDISSLSPEELILVLDCLLEDLHQRCCWQFHIAKNGYMTDFVTMCAKIIDYGAIIDRMNVLFNGEVLEPCAKVWRSNGNQLIGLFLGAGASIETWMDATAPFNFRISSRRIQ